MTETIILIGCIAVVLYVNKRLDKRRLDKKMKNILKGVGR